MFEKEKFKEALLGARGNRTNELYSKESGVSRTYISAYLNLRRDEPPTPEIIKRLANVACNNITYEDLMIAAGFLSDKYENESSLSSFRVRQNTDNKYISKSIEEEIQDLSPASREELKKYIQLLKLKDTMDKSKDEMSSPLMPNVSKNK